MDLLIHSSLMKIQNEQLIDKTSLAYYPKDQDESIHQELYQCILYGVKRDYTSINWWEKNINSKKLYIFLQS